MLFQIIYKVEFLPKKIVRIGNYIYISNGSNMYKFDIEKSELISEDNKNLKKRFDIIK
jgi:hypothetical protein